MSEAQKPHTSLPRTYVGDLANAIGQEVMVEAWVPVVRDHGKLKFLVLRDVTGTVQAIGLTPKAEDTEKAALREALTNLSMESVVKARGKVQEQAQAPGGYELFIEELEILSHAEPELPIPVTEKSGETDQALRLDYRWLDLRKPENLLIFKVWTTFEAAFRNYWIRNGYIEMHSPKLMNAASESGAEVFEVKYFDTKAYLAQSPQFYKQMAMAAGYEKVFEVGAVYRAEPSFTTRHATEFTGFDFEISFIESHEDVMKALEEMVTEAIAAVKEQHGDQIKELHGRDLIVPKLPFPRVTLAEAKELIAKHNIKTDKPGDLNPEEEKALCEAIQEKYGHEFVFVTEYPKTNRAFYHMRKDDDQNLTKGFDLMWNGVEITTGAQREHRYEILKKQAEEKGLTEESVGHYLNFFRWGCPPHGGAGIGPTRMIMKIFEAENIREVTYLHRGVNRLTP